MPPKAEAPAGKRKRTLQEVITELKPVDEVEYQPLRSTLREPELRLPADTDINDPYTLFSLFFTNDIIETIAKSTNLYAQRKRREFYQDTVIQGRTWKPTNAAEIRVFLGVVIYMGVHKSPAIKHYFEKTETSPLHLTCNYMSHTRYEQLKRFIHISDPAGDELRPPGEKDWWFKLEPLASSFRAAAQQYYQPGSNLALDELMIHCFGCSYHTVKMPNKPIQQGYKIFALAERGYMYTFAWSSRQLGIEESFLGSGLSEQDGNEQSKKRRKKEKGELCPTARMVMNMIKQLPSDSNESASSVSSSDALAVVPCSKQAYYSVYMDNYFNSVSLYKKLLADGYGACGTARPTSGIPKLL